MVMVAIHGWRVTVDYVTSILNQDGHHTDIQSTCLLKVFRFPGGYSSPQEKWLTQTICEKEGTIVSGTIGYQCSILTLKCKNEHTFNQSIKKLVYESRWCTVCNRTAKCDELLKEFQELAKSKRGRLLSGVYITAQDKYLWRGCLFFFCMYW